jgi:hypothetical protein
VAAEPAAEKKKDFAEAVPAEAVVEVLSHSLRMLSCAFAHTFSLRAGVLIESAQCR